LAQYIYSTSSKLITVQLLLFIKSQFTTDSQNILDLNQCTPGHVCSWATRRFQRSWGVCKWFDRHKKCVATVSAHFQLQLNTLGFLSDPTDKNKGYLFLNVFFQLNSKTTTFQTYVYLNFAACFGVQNSLLKYFQAYILYTQDRSTSTQSHSR